MPTVQNSKLKNDDDEDMQYNIRTAQKRNCKLTMKMTRLCNMPSVLICKLMIMMIW